VNSEITPPFNTASVFDWAEREQLAEEPELFKPAVDSIIASIDCIDTEEDGVKVSEAIMELGQNDQKSLALRLAADYTDGREQYFAADMFRFDVVRFSPEEVDNGNNSYGISRLGFYAARRNDQPLMDKIYELTQVDPEDALLEYGLIKTDWNDKPYLDMARDHLLLVRAIEASNLPEQAEGLYRRIQEFNSAVRESFRKVIDVDGLHADIIEAYARTNVDFSRQHPEHPQIVDDLFDAHAYMRQIENFHSMRVANRQPTAASIEVAKSFKRATVSTLERLCEMDPYAVADAYAREAPWQEADGRTKDRVFDGSTYKSLAHLGQTAVLEHVYSQIPETFRGNQEARSVAMSIIWSKHKEGLKDSKLRKAIQRAYDKGQILEEDAYTIGDHIDHDRKFGNQHNK
jgi:hypothetical protein